MPNCPECVGREKKKIQEKYEIETEEEDRNKTPDGQWYWTN